MARALFALVVVTAVLFAATSYVEAKPEITLTYFASRGRAEAVRVLLKYLDLEFTDVQFASRDEWLAVKESGKFAFNQVPGLTWCEDGECIDIVQSHTIMRFLSRKAGAYLEEDKRVWVDMLADGVEDFRSRYGKLAYNSDAASLQQEYLSTTVPQWLAYFERLKTTIPGTNKFFVADKATHADLFFFLVLELNVRLGGLSVLEPFPQLRQFFDDVAAIPAVSAWRTSSERHEFANGASAAIDQPGNPPAFNDFGEPFGQAHQDL